MWFGMWGNKISFKKLVGYLFGFNQELSYYKSVNNSLYTRLANCKNNVNILENNYKELSKKNNKLVKELEKFGESEEAKFWNNKYPKANIQYTGRTWGTSKDMIPIDVRLLITPQDYHIHDILEEESLYVNGTDYDKAVIKIYKWIKNNYYRYVYDKNNYGVSEFWEFPFEIMERKDKDVDAAFDCDSWANFMASFYVAAGVPEWKVRVVVGTSQLGGHSTVYVHSDDTNKFHHLNSTYGNDWIKNTKISDYPTTDDAETTDKIGIKGVWFSFNNLYSWNKFSSEAKKGYKNEGEKLFVIK